MNNNKHALFSYSSILSLQQSELFKTTNAVLKKAERIMLLAFLYFITFGVFTLTTYSKVTKSAEENSILSFQYFACEKNGRNNTCSDENIERNPAITTISLILLGVFPAFHLVYAITLQELKAYARHIRGYLKGLEQFVYKK